MLILYLHKETSEVFSVVSQMFVKESLLSPFAENPHDHYFLPSFFTV